MKQIFTLRFLGIIPGKFNTVEISVSGSYPQIWITKLCPY